MFSRHLGLAACLALGAAAFAQPTVTPFMPLPGDREGAAADQHQQFPNSAKGDNATLVVWYDQIDIRAARLDADGDVIDSSPVIVARDRIINSSLPRPPATPPGVAWNGEHWLVAYAGETTSLSGLYTTTYVFAVRIAPDGTVVDTTPITLRRSEDIDPNSNIEPGRPTVAAGPDGNWAVAWPEYNPATNATVVRGHLISAAGVVVTPQAVTMTSNTSGASAGGPDLVATDDGYLLAVITGATADAYVRRFSVSLAPTTTLLNLGSGDARRHNRVDAAAGPSEIVVAARGEDNGVYGFRLARSGTAGPINAGGVTLAPADPSQREFGINADGANWALGYTSEANFGFASSLRVRRFLPSLAPADPAPLSIPLHPEYEEAQFYRSAHIAQMAGGGVEVLWHDNAVPADDNIWGARVPAGSGPLTRELVSIELPTQIAGGLATMPDGSGVAVFVSSTAEAVRILAQRFDAAGELIDQEPIALATYRFPESAGTPSVASNGSVYMIVWPSGSKAWARRMNPDGTLIDAAPVPVLPVQEAEVVNMLGVDVAVIGDTFLVAGYSSQSFNRPYIRFARVRGSDLAVLDPTGPVLEFNISQLGGFSTPTVAPIGLPGSQVFLVAFTDFPSAGAPNIDLEFITPDGARQHAGAVANEGSTSPTLASIAGRALVAWRGTGGDGSSDIFGRFFTSGGVADSPEFLILSGPGSQTSPRLTSDGTGYLLAWSDFRHVAGGNPLDPVTSDPWAARLSPDGVSLDGTGFPLRISPASELNTRLAVLGPDRYLALYSAITAEAPNVFRAGVQTIGGGGTPCPADWNGDTLVNSNDISGFLTAWLDSVQSGNLVADFNADATVNSIDISAFLTAWLAAVQGGC